MDSHSDSPNAPRASIPTDIEPCRVYWGSHGCELQRGHDGDCWCCCDCTDHAQDAEAEGCVGAAPYYGPATLFYGEDAAARGLPVVHARRPGSPTFERVYSELYDPKEWVEDRLRRANHIHVNAAQRLGAPPSVLVRRPASWCAAQRLGAGRICTHEGLTGYLAGIMCVKGCSL